MWLKCVLWHMPVAFQCVDNIVIKARTRPTWAWFTIRFSFFQGEFCSLNSSQTVERAKYVVLKHFLIQFWFEVPSFISLYLTRYSATAKWTEMFTEHQLLPEDHGSHFNRFWALLFPFRSQTFLEFMGRFKLNSSKLLPSLEMGGGITLLIIKHLTRQDSYWGKEA